MFVVIDATVIRGFGVASKNIMLQKTHWVWQFPDIKNIHAGSINVQLDKPLHILSYDYTTLPTPWWDVDESHPGRWAVEKFSFLKINFEYPTGGPVHSAWFFNCHNSAYANDPNRFEIISERIDGVFSGQRCKIHIEKSKLRK